MRKVSVIIPIYNTEKYLSRCLSSVCNQTYKNLEIICVDDGSTDRSGEIAELFAQEDERIVLVHQTNGGESKARNTGLKLCTGAYIGFVDCDDWIEMNMYEELVRAIEESGTDLTASGWFRDTETGSEEIRNALPVSGKPFGREMLLEYIYRRDAYRGFAYMWNKLYSRRLFYDQKGELLLFNEELKLGGDVLYLAQLVTKADSAFYIDSAFYHYFQRSDSGCHSYDLNNRMDWLKAYQMVLHNFEQGGIDPYIVDLVKRFLAYHSSNVAEMAYEQRNQEILCICQQIMKAYQYEYEKMNQEYPKRIEGFQEVLLYSCV